MLYVFTIGEYSDEQIVAICHGPYEFDFRAAKNEWRKAAAPTTAYDLGRRIEDVAIAWLERHPDFKLLDWREIRHIDLD